MGLTLIWGMMNFINFAHGEFVMLGMYVALLVVVWLPAARRCLRHGGGARRCSSSASAIYLSLIRHVFRGPMLSQILSTFGLALLLRYRAFYIFSANFVSLPQTSLSGTINLGGIFLPVAQLVAGAVAIALTLGAALAAHPHHYWQQARGGRRSRRRDADGDPARPHAGAGLGAVGGRCGHGWRLDGYGLSVVARRSARLSG